MNMKRILLAATVAASVPGGLAFAEGDGGTTASETTETTETTTTTVRSASSATSATIAFDSRIQTVDASEALPEFGTQPLGALFIVR